MPVLDAVLIAVSVLALLGVIFEEVIHVNKAKTTLFFRHPELGVAVSFQFQPG